MKLKIASLHIHQVGLVSLF